MGAITGQGPPTTAIAPLGRPVAAADGPPGLFIADIATIIKTAVATKCIYLALS